MKKSDLLKLFKTMEAIGELFADKNHGVPITRSAVSQWPEAIPELREYQLRELMPDIDERIGALRRRKRA